MDCSEVSPGFAQMQSLGHEQNTLVPRARKGGKVIYINVKFLRW
jgi:hypothetical protein